MAETNPQIEQQNPRITWDGCSVLLDINDGDRLVFSRLSAGASLKIGDKKCSLRPLIGCPFGSLFQVETGPKGPFLTRILASAEGDQQEKGEFESKEEMKDNRALVDNNTAQTLSGEDINAMRRQGATGDQIVEALIANSSTFANKTSFSQEKYRVKKQKKYAPRVLLRRPFARSICEAYFKKYPAKIGFLRVDALSLLLSLANVSAYSDVLVVDMVGGMLTGAVAERLGGTGYVCNAYLGATPYQMDIVRIFNFNNKICSRILRSPLSDLRLAQSDISEQPEPLEIASSSQFQSNVAECISSCASLPKPEDQMIKDVSGPSSNPICNEETTLKSENEMPDAVLKSIDETDASSVVRPCKAAKAGEKASQQNINLWKENGFSSLIIAAPDQDAWSIVKELLPLLSYSAPFAIYHQYLQPLATCMHNLQVAKMAIGLQISEPWLREYQNFVDLVQGVAPNPKFLQEDSCIKILTSLLLHQDVTNFDVEYLSGLVDCIDWLNLADIDSCRVHEKHVTPGVCWLLYCTCNPELFLFDCTQVFANAYCETSFAKYFLMI